MNDAFVFNIHSDWLFNNLKNINNTNKTNKDMIYIFSDQAGLIQSDDTDVSFSLSLKEKYTQYWEKYKNNEGFFESKIEGTQYLVSYLKVDKTDWTLIKVQRYDEYYAYVNKLRISIIVITAIFLLLSFGAAISISRRIYSPIDGLMTLVKGNSGAQDNALRERDEISALKDIFHRSSEKLIQYKSQLAHTDKILKAYNLKRLIMDASGGENDAIFNLFPQVSETDRFAVCILAIDHYREFNETYSSRDKELLKFAVMNIISEMVTPAFQNETLDFKNDRMIMICKIGSHVSGHEEILTEAIRKGQDVILEYYKLSISASISHTSNQLADINTLYEITSENLSYRFLFGKKCIITQDFINENQKNTDYEYPLEIEKDLLNSIRSGELAKAEKELERIRTFVSSMNYHNIILSLHILMNSIKRSVDELNRVKLTPININVSAYIGLIFQIETMDELFIKIHELIEKIIEDKTLENVNKKHIILSDTIKDIVNSNYFQPGLCIGEIADSLKMSPNHINKIFKQHNGISVPEYISEVRLSKAAEWLEKSRLSINEIMNKVGIEYESQFYKLFKRRFGITPKEYAIKKNAIDTRE